MMPLEWTHALIGGLIIGAAVSLMLLMNGRVTGISGIVNGAITPQKGDTPWRWLFIAGLWLGGLALKVLRPESFGSSPHSNSILTLAAGLLVGFGTIMGSGCTSGHGICGISRLSPRSLVATGIFMIAGVFAVYVLRTVGVLP